MPHIRVGRWGNNLAVRFPVEIAAAAAICEGERVEIDAQEDEIVIRRSTPHFTLGELFRGRSPTEWREEYTGAYDWGPDIGREVVED